MLKIVGAIILTAVFLSGCLGGGGASWVPKVGDFVEYTTVSGEFNQTMRWTIKEITDTEMTINTSMSMGGSPPYYFEITIPKNQTFGWNLDPENPPSGLTVTKVGTENVDTKWGSRSCEHYTFSYTTTTFTQTGDMWIRGGIFVKVTGAVSEQTFVMTLTDTNISQITNP